VHAAPTDFARAETLLPAGLADGRYAGVAVRSQYSKKLDLTVLSGSDITAIPVRNLPGDITVEYIATLPDGKWLVVTRPSDDWTYDDFRLFLGPTDQIAERAVSSVIRFRDGGSTTITFDYDGSSTVASFPVVLSDASFSPGPATLTIAGATISLTRQPTLPTATYLCL
jgi:hypothetical protein